MNEQTRISTGETESRKNQTPFSKGTRSSQNFVGQGSSSKMAAQARRASMTPPPGIAGACWIPLTKGLFALVDECDYPAVSTLTWTAMVLPRTNYAYFRRRLNGQNPMTLLHRMLTGAADEQQVDHRDGNGLNCRRHNMRVCTVAQNHRNVRKCAVETSSRFKGVTWDKGRNRWMGKIKLDGHSIFLGRFETETDAAVAYNKAAVLNFGEYALLNLVCA